MCNYIIPGVKECDETEFEKNKNLVMYCTGGIRCEKASAYFKHVGFEKVYQLEGGIIEYARQVEQKGLENKFKGKKVLLWREKQHLVRFKPTNLGSQQIKIKIN